MGTMSVFLCLNCISDSLNLLSINGTIQDRDPG